MESKARAWLDAKYEWDERSADWRDKEGYIVRVDEIAEAWGRAVLEEAEGRLRARAVQIDRSAVTLKQLEEAHGLLRAADLLREMRTEYGQSSK